MSARTTIVNQSRDTTIADTVEIAASFWRRGKGLIGRTALPDGYGLVIRPCGSIHMFFMALPLDVLHLDREGRVVKILHGIKPWRLGPIVPRGKWVVELPVGAVARSGTQLGDVIALVDESAGATDAA